MTTHNNIIIIIIIIRGVAHLFDDEDAVVELLRLQERMHVLKEDLQVVAAVAVRNDDGDTVAGATRERPPAPPGGEVRLLRLQLLQQRHRLVDGDTPHCRRHDDRGLVGAPAGKVGDGKRQAFDV